MAISGGSNKNDHGVGSAGSPGVGSGGGPDRGRDKGPGSFGRPSARSTQSVGPRGSPGVGNQFGGSNPGSTGSSAGVAGGSSFGGYNDGHAAPSAPGYTASRLNDSMSFGQRMFGGKYGVTDNKQLSRPTFGNRFANSLIGAATLGFVDPNFSTELAGDLPTVSRPEINPVSGSLGIAGLGTLGSIASLAGLDVDDSIGTNINLGAPSVQTAGLNKGIPTATDTKRQILAKILQENASG